MKITLQGENLIERLMLMAGKVPAPMFETLIGLLLVRTVMAGAKLGVFEALAEGERTASEVASTCGTDPRATEKLLNALVGCGYLTFDDGHYGLTSNARSWMLKDAPQSLLDNILFRYLEWDIIEEMEQFVQTGQSTDVHNTIESAEEWRLYQCGMRSMAGTYAGEVAKRMPVPAGARDMLDVGGSHGCFSVELCRRYPELRAVVLDLPQAIEHAAPLLAAEGIGDRVSHRAGDALTDDFGEETWDVIFMSHLAHHFDEGANGQLARKAARGLRPGGIFVIQELIRPASPTSDGQPGPLLDLYFALTSEAGTWSIEEIAAWQDAAGLEPKKPIWIRSAPGIALQVAGKAPST